MSKKRPFKIGDKVEARWEGEFCIQEQHFAGYSWWQARISEISTNSHAYTVKFEGWDGWDEIVDVSSIRWPRINTDFEMNQPLPLGSAIEMRCNSMNAPEIWLETMVSHVGQHGIYWAKTMPLEESDETIFVARCSLRPALLIDSNTFNEDHIRENSIISHPSCKAVRSINFHIYFLRDIH
jgi:hypothetical protein